MKKLIRDDDFYGGDLYITDAFPDDLGHSWNLNDTVSIVHAQYGAYGMSVITLDGTEEIKKLIDGLQEILDS